MRDSEQGIEKVAVGHHIGERAHLIERQRDTNSGDQEENQDFVNLDTGKSGHVLDLFVMTCFR